MSITETLSNGKITVSFTSFGGTITSIKDENNIEYLWQGDADYWTGQAPILFPICGSIRDNKAVTKDGKSLSMGRHGIVRKEEFALEEKTADSITFSITSTDSMKEKYPYDFKLYAKYELIGKSLKTTYTVENIGNEDMPFSVGGHPGFNCPLIEGEDYTDYEIQFEKNETCTVPTLVTETGLINITDRTPFFKNENVLPLKHDLFHKDAIQFDEIDSRSVKYVSKKSEKGLNVEFKDMPYLCIWSTANDGPFVAIEPWVGISTCNDESDIFEEKRNIQIAKPSEKKSYSYTISVL